MSDLQELVERRVEDPELVPTIVPVDARLLFAMPVSALLDIVSRVAALVPSKEVIPGTSMMLIEAVPATAGTADHVKVSASDGSQWMQVVSSGPVRVRVGGSAVVPAKKILESLKLAPEWSVLFGVVGSQARVQSGRALWTFATPLSDTLSTAPELEDVDTSPVPSAALLRSLQDVLPATDRGSARAAFLQVHIANGEVSATDGARLHKSALGGSDETLSFDVPLAVAPRVVQLLEASQEDEVSIGVSPSRVYFHWADARVVSQRILLPFPDVTPIVLGASISNETSVVVETKELLDAVARVRVNSDPERAVIRLRASAGSLALSSQDRNGNEAQETLPAQWTHPRPAEVSVNHKHLVEALKRLREQHAILLIDPIRGVKSPILIAEGGFQAILSPMI